MNEQLIDTLRKRKIIAHTAIVVAEGSFIGFTMLGVLMDVLYHRFPKTAQVWETITTILGIGMWGAMLTILVALFSIWYYTFHAVRIEADLRHAIAHVLLWIVLAPVCLTGIPLLIYLQIDKRKPAKAAEAERS